MTVKIGRLRPGTRTGRADCRGNRPVKEVSGGADVVARLTRH
jgi:hypothetical protein